jgi:1-deoxy-D-xylulose-5-phosphate reductoisomerase
MGRKISVDSATMMNKALEVIEARYLFGMKPDQLDVVIHPQSVIHSMVQYQDNSVVAQLGTPDMRVPIAYGLSWPERMTSGASALDFHALAAMTFEAMDDHGHPERFPGLHLAWETLNGAPGSCALLNAANEISVEAFLNRQIRFDQIHTVNRATLDRITSPAPQNLNDLMDLDRRGREAAKSIVQSLGV